MVEVTEGKKVEKRTFLKICPLPTVNNQLLTLFFSVPERSGLLGNERSLNRCQLKNKGS